MHGNRGSPSTVDRRGRSSPEPAGRGRWPGEAAAAGHGPGEAVAAEAAAGRGGGDGAGGGRARRRWRPTAARRREEKGAGGAAPLGRRGSPWAREGRHGGRQREATWRHATGVGVAARSVRRGWIMSGASEGKLGFSGERKIRISGGGALNRHRGS